MKAWCGVIDPELIQRALVCRVEVLEAECERHTKAIADIYTLLFPTRKEPPPAGAELLALVYAELQRLGVGKARSNGE